MKAQINEKSTIEISLYTQLTTGRLGFSSLTLRVFQLLWNAFMDSLHQHLVPKNLKIHHVPLQTLSLKQRQELKLVKMVSSKHERKEGKRWRGRPVGHSDVTDDAPRSICAFGHNENLILVGLSLLLKPSRHFSLPRSQADREAASDCVRANHSTKFWAAPSPLRSGEGGGLSTEVEVPASVMPALYASVWRTSWRRRFCWAASALSPYGRALSSWCLWPRSPGPSPAYSAACYPVDEGLLLISCS